MKKILVVAAHPDDEALGCAGTLAKHIAHGDQIHLLFMAEGEGARMPGNIAASPQLQQMMALRQKMACSAAELLGAEPPLFLGLPDNQMDRLPLLEVIQQLEQAVSDLQPDIIYTHHGGDLNIDHRITAQAVLTAFRPQPGCSVRAIYGFEVNSSTEWSAEPLAPAFVPTRFVDISNYETTKAQVLECYQSELRDYPHSRSLEAIFNLNRWRGNSVGMAMAEAFSIYRQLD